MKITRARHLISVLENPEQSLAVKEKASISLMGRELDDCDKTNVILRLNQLLMSENANIVSNILSIFIDQKSLNQELAVALMKQLGVLLMSGSSLVLCEDNMRKILMLLSVLLVDTECPQEMQKKFASSKCLSSILTYLQMFDPELHSNGVVFFQDISDILISSTCTPKNLQNSSMTMEILAPLVKQYLNSWTKPDFSTTSGEIFREILFVTRTIVSNHTSLVDILLRNGAVEALVLAFRQFDLMREHAEIDLGIRRGAYENHVDCSKTLFCSIVLLFKEAIEKNEKAAQKASELDAVNSLRKFLDVVNIEDHWYIISCLETLEESTPVSYSDLLEVDKDFSKNDSPARKMCVRSGTPHPRKFKPRNTMIRVNCGELVDFMKLVRIYGVNMQNVRKVWPYHKDLTPADLYKLWKAIWKKK